MFQRRGALFLVQSINTVSLMLSKEYMCVRVCVNRYRCVGSSSRSVYIYNVYRMHVVVAHTDNSRR